MGFCMVKYLSFHDSSFFGVNITFNVNGKATVCHTPCLFWYVQKKKKATWIGPSQQQSLKHWPK
jgi:hypothetical protein